MKSSEYHRGLEKRGWRCLRQTGSHRTYEKDGAKITVPFHGSQEMSEGIIKKYSKIVGWP
ncbi:MAG: type II toxin-antitoxin system HicA family toxin [Prevotella sp.]|nr:type II toxin-antitoxin system HicA family toxin [Prevotella sp.]